MFLGSVQIVKFFFFELEKMTTTRFSFFLSFTLYLHLPSPSLFFTLSLRGCVVTYDIACMQATGAKNLSVFNCIRCEFLSLRDKWMTLEILFIAARAMQILFSIR